MEANLWEEVQMSLRKRRLRKAFYYALSSAAAVALVFMFLINPQRGMQEMDFLAAVAGYEMNATVSGGHSQKMQQESVLEVVAEKSFQEDVVADSGADESQKEVAWKSKKMKSVAAQEERPAVKEDIPVPEETILQCLDPVLLNLMCKPRCHLRMATEFMILRLTQKT